MIERPDLACPVCNKTGTVVFHDDLGRDGRFCICSEPQGCGSTFIMTPEGEFTDIF
jgi:phage/plasmid primase-like uncharacterized protein